MCKAYLQTDICVGSKGMMGNTHNSVLGSHATTGGVSGIVGKLLIIDSRNGD